MQCYWSVPGHSHAPVSCNFTAQFQVILVLLSLAMLLVISWSFSCPCLMQCHWSVPCHSHAPFSCNVIGQFLVILMLQPHAMSLVSSWSFPFSSLTQCYWTVPGHSNAPVLCSVVSQFLVFFRAPISCSDVSSAFLSLSPSPPSCISSSVYILVRYYQLFTIHKFNSLICFFRLFLIRLYTYL